MEFEALQLHMAWPPKRVPMSEDGLLIRLVATNTASPLQQQEYLYSLGSVHPRENLAVLA